MRRIARNLILVVLLAVVLFAPLFEIFDQSGDMDQGSDFVLTLLCVFMATGLFLLCRTIISFLFRFGRIVTIHIPSQVLRWTTRPTEAAPSPPSSLLSFGSLRI